MSSNHSSHESQKIQEATQFLQSGELDAAQELLLNVISSNPKNHEALHLLGLVYYQLNHFTESLRVISEAIQLHPQNPLYLANRAEVLRENGWVREAIGDLNLSIKLNPLSDTSYFNRAICYHQLKDYDKALADYVMAIKNNPQNFQYHFQMGNIYAELCYYDSAIHAYNEALKLNPNYPIIWTNLGTVYDKSDKLQEASQCFEKAVQLNPYDSIAFSNLGSVLCEQNLYYEALAACSNAIELDPKLSAAYSNLANVLSRLKRYHNAILYYKKALELNPSDSGIYFNCGTAYSELNLVKEALEYFNRALELNPKNYKALYNRAMGKLNNKSYPVRDALADLEEVVKLNSETEITLGLLIVGYLNICEWDKFENIKTVLVDKMRNNLYISNPLQLMSVFDSSEVLYKNAVQFVNKNYPVVSRLKPAHKKHPKIKIGYFSGDFRAHPVAYLIRELLALHNREDFEIYAFSFLKEERDLYTSAISKSVDRFFDVKGRSPQEITDLVKSLEIDIAVDLGIFTGNQLSVFKDRIAPLQINFLGYCGTSGSTFMDYIIADSFTIPTESEKYFSEKIIRLPSFMPRDTLVRPSPKTYTRAEVGLPSTGFVFGCMSGYGKILPEMFKSWITILKQVPGSVLVLGENKDHQATEHLRNLVKNEGIAPERLVFFKKLDSYNEYLSRLKLVDLFLDTFPYGAHTNCNDALWAGVPVLTIAGETFSSRVGASFLAHLKLDELITASLNGYIAKAVNLANNPTLVSQLKTKLAKQKEQALLYNMPYYTQKLEEAFRKVYQLSTNNSPVEHITIPS